MAVVAHFDDALIWMGGTIRRTRRAGWGWTIVCACAAEPSRREYFLDSCKDLGVRGIALDFTDHPDGEPFSRNNRETLLEAVRQAISDMRSCQAPIAWAFTHNPDARGEYGLHPNHTEAARVVAELIEGTKCGLAQFAYHRIAASPGSPVAARTDATYLVQLDYDDLAWKAEWCARARDVELRDSALGGVSWLERLGWPCPNPEAFSADADLPPPFVKL